MLLDPFELLELLPEFVCVGETTPTDEVDVPVLRLPTVEPEVELDAPVLRLPTVAPEVELEAPVVAAEVEFEAPVLTLPIVDEPPVADALEYDLLEADEFEDASDDTFPTDEPVVVAGRHALPLPLPFPQLPVTLPPA